MNTPTMRRERRGLRRRQHGMTLIEMMIAAVISLVSIGIMLVLVGNTLRSGTDTIRMTRLTQELRSALQVMSRDLRRANYHRGFIACFANADCRTDLGIASQINTVNINGGSNCVWYWFDRDGDGDVTDDDVGAFRLAQVGGVGTLQMRDTGNGAPNCAAAVGWQSITDPQLVNVTSFIVSDAASYGETLSASGATQSVEKIRVSISGQLRRDAGIRRQVEDLIFVRNPTQET